MNIPNGQEQQPGGSPGGAPQMNPVVDAVKTIGVYIAGLAEKGDPTAPELQQIMAQFVQALRKGVEGGAGQEQPAGGGGEPTPVRQQQDQAPGGGRGANPMLGNMAGGARSMNRGQVAVI
jgi:hypothetical protein